MFTSSTSLLAQTCWFGSRRKWKYDLVETREGCKQTVCKQLHVSSVHVSRDTRDAPLNSQATVISHVAHEIVTVTAFSRASVTYQNHAVTRRSCLKSGVSPGSGRFFEQITPHVAIACPSGTLPQTPRSISPISPCPPNHPAAAQGPPFSAPRRVSSVHNAHLLLQQQQARRGMPSCPSLLLPLRWCRR